MARHLPVPRHVPLERNANCNSGSAWISAVVQVIAVVQVRDINIISLIPVAPPVFRVWVNGAEPISTVLETWIAPDFHERQAVDAEPVIPAIVAAVIVVRDAIAAVTAALLPGAVFGFPTMGATLLPCTVLFAFLRTLLLRCTLHLHMLYVCLLVLLLRLLLLLVLVLSLLRLLLLLSLRLRMLRRRLGLLLFVLLLCGMFLLFSPALLDGGECRADNSKKY